MRRILFTISFIGFVIITLARETKYVTRSDVPWNGRTGINIIDK